VRDLDIDKKTKLNYLLVCGLFNDTDSDVVVNDLKITAFQYYLSILLRKTSGKAVHLPGFETCSSVTKLKRCGIQATRT
jgi:hypothetical protein